MFNSAFAFNQNISSWDTAKVISMLAMFQSARAFNQNLTSWSTDGLLVATSMFSSADAFDCDCVPPAKTGINYSCTNTDMNTSCDAP